MENAVNEFNNSPCYISDATEELHSQLSEIQGAFDTMDFAFQEDLDSLRDNKSQFSITLFGRTMAGKSTLREILTHGDGSTIGKGAQRTTRDVIAYSWKSLKITDVPGIGAFKGEDDEQIAFNAAKSADIVLFLITDDAPQAAEAECLGRIIDIGKPVICIMNVKATANGSIRMVTRDIERRFDQSRLSEIRKQFLSYAGKLGQDWDNIPFVYVHLKSAFLAQSEANAEIAKQYYKLSRLDSLTNTILQQVTSRGEFYRIKTFVDIISIPILESMENLLNQSTVNRTQGRTILEKKAKMTRWKSAFENDSQIRIRSLINQIQGQLNSEVASFAEDHFSDQHADKAWESILNGYHIDKRCQTLLNELEEKCNDQIREITREIQNELKFSSSFSADRTLKMNKIIDARKVWNWSSTIAGGGLTIAAGISYFLGSIATGPLGWAALAVSAIGILGSLLFKSRERKETEAREKLEKKLKENVSKICQSLQKTMDDNLRTLIDARVSSLINELDQLDKLVFRLANTQKDLAWRLDNHLLELNLRLVEEGVNLIQANGIQYWISEVARIPGKSMVLLLNEVKYFPEKERNQLQQLTSEEIYFIEGTNDMKALISRVFGETINDSQIHFDSKNEIAHVPLNGASPKLIDRARLAQQLSRITITA